jgi:cytochrome c551/c552
MKKLILVLGGFVGIVVPAVALEIHFPLETGVFKQAPGAELANGQCLVCHSVEYVTTQPKMPRPFWKASVVKMQQKYGAAIPDSQVEALADYLTVNYGVSTNLSATVSPTPSSSTSAQTSDGPALATRLGCFGCHNPTTKIIGPAYHDIALKYKSDPEAASKIEQQIHKGGSGKWGPMIMPPFPQVNAQETKALTEWILGLK